MVSRAFRAFGLRTRGAVLGLQDCRAFAGLCRVDRLEKFIGSGVWPEVHAQAVTAFGGHAPAAQLLKLAGPLEFRLGFQPGALSPTPYAYVHPKPQKL